MNRVRLIVGCIVGLILCPSAWAFPENVRHHYANCTSCHLSPSGGGLLTQYGRELSKEIQSTWGAEKEQRFAYFIDPPEWLNLGGDVRYVQTYRDTPRATELKEEGDYRVWLQFMDGGQLKTVALAVPVIK